MFLPGVWRTQQSGIRFPSWVAEGMAASYSGREAKVGCAVSGNKFSLEAGKWMLMGFLWSNVNPEQRNATSTFLSREGIKNPRDFKARARCSGAVKTAG